MYLAEGHNPVPKRGFNPDCLDPESTTRLPGSILNKPLFRSLRQEMKYVTCTAIEDDYRLEKVFDFKRDGTIYCSNTG